MKIAFISMYPQKEQKHIKASGVASYAKNLVDNIPLGTDDSLTILCNKDGQRDTYNEGTATIIRCFDRNPVFIFQLWREIQRIKPDVIHIQQELALFGNALTAYLLQLLVLVYRKKIVLTLHGVVSIKKINSDFVQQNNSRLPVWIIKLAFIAIFKPLTVLPKTVIVHEEFFKSILVNEYKTRPDKIQVVHHGVEDFTPHNKSEARKRLGLPDNAQIVLFMGYLAGYKGLDLLIDGFSLLLKSNPDVHLIVGAGKHPKLATDEAYLRQYETMQQYAASHIPKEQLHWVGFIPEAKINDYYSASDVSVYPYTVAMSSSGPMSMAIGYNKPFLASNVFSGIFNNGVLFDTDASSLEKKLSNFFNKPDVYMSYFAALRNDRLWSKIGAQTYEIYRK